MFEHIQPLPEDPILSLMAACRADSRPDRIDLSVGVYRDARGQTPVLAAVRRAEQIHLQHQQTKAYQGMAGDPGFLAAIAGLWRDDASRGEGDRWGLMQTTGGTGALRQAAELIARCRRQARVWLGRPCWGNHPGVFQAAGLALAEYPHADPAGQRLDGDRLLATLAQVPAGDVVLLQVGCHNPTGIDLPLPIWDLIAEMALRRGFLVLLDLAYQGLADGLHADAEPVRRLAARLPELLLCVSFSKNFGLYRERTGALAWLAGTPAAVRAVQSQLFDAVRASVSMPPAHGAAVVAGILTDAGLRRLWQDELEAMRLRLRDVRAQLAGQLQAAGSPRDFSFLLSQRGMFCFLGIDAGQARYLRERHGVYVLDSGRANLAGLHAGNIERFAVALVDTLRR